MEEAIRCAAAPHHRADSWLAGSPERKRERERERERGEQAAMLKVTEKKKTGSLQAEKGVL